VRIALHGINKKGVEIGERQNRCHDDTLVDSDILNKKDVLWPPNKYASIENKTVYLI